MFSNRAAALQACFPYWSGMECFDPGTGAGKHDTSPALNTVGTGEGAVDAQAHLYWLVIQKPESSTCSCVCEDNIRGKAMPLVTVNSS